MIVIRRWSADRLCILLPFDFETIDHIREIIGRKWHPEEKVWSFPDSEESIRQVVQILSHQTVRIHPALNHPFLKKELALKNELNHKNELKKQQVQNLTEQLKLKGYSRTIQKAYISHVERFEKFNDLAVSLIQ